MKVYRIEHEWIRHTLKGFAVGPYGETQLGVAEHGEDEWWDCENEEGCAHEFSAYISGESYDNDTHPVPEYDGLPFEFSTDYIFGFQSMEQLSNWFSRFFDGLHAHGFVIGVYDTNDYMIGGSQMIFNHLTAKLDEVRYIIEPLPFG